MEEKLIGEQPKEVLDEVQSGIVENVEEGITHENFNGSLGKFKDAQSLLNAYNNLQAEFTKKCQKLSELIKSENVEGEQKETQTNVENQKQDHKENIETQNIKNEKEISEQNVPIYKSAEWNKKVADFLTANESAREYSKQISDEILNDEALQQNQNALELAWARVMQKEFASPNKLASDQNFIREKILSNDQIKWQIINEYFKDIQSKKVPPLIASSGVVATATIKQPTNMAEAKEVVQKLFNLKGK